MAFHFNKEEERLAIEGADELILPYLRTYNESRWFGNKNWPTRVCQGDISAAVPDSNAQPPLLPLTLDGLKASHDELTTLQGFWSILWFNDRYQQHDVLYDDGFRSVIMFGKAGLELSLRPLHEDPPGYKTKRLFLAPGDVQDCLHVAQNVVGEAASREPAQQIAEVIGQGTVMNPLDRGTSLVILQHPRITFEWKIARAPKARLAYRIQSWRYTACGGAKNYQKLEGEYLKLIKSLGRHDPREGQRSWAVSGTRKRSSLEMAAIQGIGPRLKRQSTGSSQYSSGSQSSVGSPEVLRPPPAAGRGPPIMGPPPPVGLGQSDTNIEHPFRHQQNRRGSRGSRGRIGFATSRVEGLTVQSPERAAPPPEGSPWGGHQGVARMVAGQSGRGHEAQAPTHVQQDQGFPPQIPGHGHQVPGQVQQAPAYGQPTEVYGHMRTDFQGPPQREFRAGIAHTQQFAAHGGWNPQHPGQPQEPVGRAPEQHTLQRGHARFVDTQSGGGYAGGSGHNVPAFGGSGTGPMHHRQDIQPLPPPAMRDIDQAHFQAQPPLPPAGQNYPSSLHPATHPMVAEHEHVPADSESDLESESESESEGEDDQMSHQGTRVTQPLLHTGGQGDPRMYESPPPMPQDPSYGDVFMGAGASDNDASDEDNFRRR